MFYKLIYPAVLKLEKRLSQIRIRPLRRYLKAKKFEAKKTEQLESHYQVTFNIPALKIRQNNLLGFFIDVPKKYTDNLPAQFRLRQGLAQSSRYSTTALEEIVQEIAHVESETALLERRLFEELVHMVLVHQAI